MVYRDINRPMPQTEDILERTRHLNQIKFTAEELVLNDILSQLEIA